MILRLLALLLCAFIAQAAEPPASDQKIEAELRQRLAKSVIGKDGFTPRIKDGVVYWTGTTSVAQHKGAATRMAKSAGARRVVNNIRVTGAKNSAPAQPAPIAKPAVPSPKPAVKPTAAPAAEPAPQPTPPQPTPMKRATVRWVPVQR